MTLAPWYRPAMLVRVLVVVLFGVGLPLAISQLLPPNDLTERSPVIPLAVLFALGGLAGWVAPSARAWMVTAAGVVVAAALVLLAWTDLLLNVTLSITAVDAWRTHAFVAIGGSVAVVSAGFGVGAVVRRRGSPGRVRVATSLAIGAVAVACIAGAALTAAAFSRSALVLQDDVERVTVTVTDAGIEVTPSAIDGREYHLVYASIASRPLLVAAVAPLSAGDGTPRAMTAAELALWTKGDWAALDPSFHGAVSWFEIGPGERRYGGLVEMSPSPDGTGGALWYVARRDAVRPWPPGSYGDADPEPAPWPIDDHVAVPVGGD